MQLFYVPCQLILKLPTPLFLHRSHPTHNVQFMVAHP